jgi:DNA-binding response OmpR family regulator
MVNPPLPYVLILQDEPSGRSELSTSLVNAGYQVEVTAVPSQALAWLTDGVFDVMVLDLDTDNLDSVAFMQAVSRLQPELQIVVLTARPTLLTAIAAIRTGATDYLVKPIELSIVVDSVRNSLESLAALKSQLTRLIRQAGKINSDPDEAFAAGENGAGAIAVIIVPPLRLDFNHRRVSLVDDAAQTIDLSRGETSVLACLMSNPNQPLTTSQLARLAWRYELDTNESAELIRPYIHRLRRKLEQNPVEPSLIITVRGSGYLYASDRSSAEATTN